MVLDGNLVLTNDNTISNGDKEYSISEFEKMIEGNNFNEYDLVFDEKRKLFFIYIKDDEYYLLRLNNEIMKLLEEGIIDPSLQRLIDFANKCQKIRKGRKADENFLQTGDYPTDLEELDAYKEFIERKLSQTKARITKSVSYSILSLGSFTSCFVYPFVSGDFSLLSYFSFIIYAFGSLGLGFYLMDKHFKTGVPLVKINKFIKVCKNYEEKIKKIEEISSSLSKKVEPNEVQTATNYSNIFLQELRNTIELILQLPIRERIGFIEDLEILLNEYIKKADEMLESDGLTMGIGKSSNIWKLNYDMLFKIVELKGEVENNLNLTFSKEELANDVKEVQDSLNLLCNNREYKDMRYEMFEEEINSLCKY